MRRSVQTVLYCGLVLLLWLSLPVAVLANGGPAEWAGNEYGGTLVPAKNNAIAVLSERLSIDFAKAHGEGMVTVPIRATYRLCNESSALQVALVAFPFWWTSHHGYSPFVDFEPNIRASLDGKPLPVQRAASLQAAMPAVLERAGVDLAHEKAPAGGGLLRDLWTAGPSSPWMLRAVAFEVGLAAGEESTLEVSYPQHAGVSHIDASWREIMQIDYILRTASYWKRFDDLEIEVLAPRGMSLESNLPLSKVEGRDAHEADRYVYRWAGLPDSNLRVAVGEPFPTPVHGAIYRFFGSGNEQQRQMVIQGLLTISIPVVVWIAVALYADRGARRSPQ